MLHEEGKTIICPYNTAHFIRQKRMQTHLVKCRKNYLTQDFAICPLDSTHHVPRPELEFHLDSCPKRSVVDSALVEQKSDITYVAPPLSKALVQSLLPPTEESWDDVSAPAYDPIANCANRNVIRTLKNARPAEKRHFQIAERLRLIKLQEEMKDQGPVEREPPLENAETVRMPKTKSQAVAVLHSRYD